ncbi:MAG TPA: DUF6582 domain-containing protein [Terriglobales bacterium]|nr:DUF6582 domain-containing protein [Terriglobales bacterium]
MKENAMVEKNSDTALATWRPLGSEEHGKLDTAQTNDLPDSAFAFPHSRKEPMTDAAHVRNAIARFDQVQDVSDAERKIAFANIEKAARHYDINMKETNWHQLGSRPHTPNQAQRKRA